MRKEDKHLEIHYRKRCSTLMLTYTSLVKPILENGTENYFCASTINLNKLDRVQSSAVRIITVMIRSCPTDLVLFECDKHSFNVTRSMMLAEYFNKLISYGDRNRTSIFFFNNLTNKQRLKRESPFS